MVNAAGTHAYVPNINSGTVSVISTATNTVTSTITVGAPVLHEAINPAGTTLYVDDIFGNVSVIDLASATITATITGLTGDDGMAVSPDGSTLYVTRGSQDKVAKISTATSTVTATIAIPGSATNIAVNSA